MREAVTDSSRSVTIKIGVLIAVLVGAHVVLGLACAEIFRRYQVVFSPGRELLLLAVWVLGSMALVMVAAGLLAALVRPFRMIVLACGLCSLALVLILDTPPAVSAALGLGYAVLAAGAAHSVVGELRGRLRFSVGAVRQGQGLLVQALIFLVAISLGLGYRDDAVAQGFIVPPALHQAITEIVLPRVQSQVEAHIDATSKATGAALASEKAAALETIRGDLDRTLADIERSFEPYAGYVWIALAFMMVSVLNISQALLSWVPALALSGTLLLLRRLGVARFVTEATETKRLLLD